MALSGIRRKGGIGFSLILLLDNPDPPVWWHRLAGPVFPVPWSHPANCAWAPVRL